jgi:Fe-Mn family superoxide dismutase
MAFELMPLPYDSEALAPAISAETLSFHHGKHHKAYLDKTNAAIEGTELAGADLETVIAKARGTNQGLFNNAAQSWNHGFYWHSLSPAAIDPSGELATKIDESFGSYEELKKQLAERGAGHFASGWVWLANKAGKLTIEETHDGDTLADSGFTPLLTVDVWEHAYYLDYQNKRPDYLSAVIDRHLNWDFAAENLARGAVWKYPAKAYADQ